MIKFTPSQDFAKALEQAQQDLEVWYSVRSRPGERRGTDDLTGEQSKALMHNRTATLTLLQSQDVKSRLAAISLVADYWPPSEALAGVASQCINGNLK